MSSLRRAAGSRGTESRHSSTAPGRLYFRPCFRHPFVLIWRTSGTLGSHITRFRSPRGGASLAPSAARVSSGSLSSARGSRAMAAATLQLRRGLLPAGLRAFRAVTPSARRAGAMERTSRSGKAVKRKALPPRTEKMDVNQDWPSVYPVAAPFKPSAVPLPIRMGYPVKKGVPMEKEGNLELVKIPNFLHLTPVAIKRHCEALKEQGWRDDLAVKSAARSYRGSGFDPQHPHGGQEPSETPVPDFCTEWPATLDSDEKCEKHFPVEIDTADYVSSGPSSRNPKARIVTLRVKLSSLNLDDHAKKKLIKLVGERYCKATDVLTIQADRCPLKRQNYDYAMYLLTVLYHESWKTEEWEKNKTESDMEEYVWGNSASKRNLLQTLLRMKAAEESPQVSEEQLLRSQEVKGYQECVVRLKNEGENEASLSRYKESVKRLLHLT